MGLDKAADLIRKMKNTTCSVVVVAAGSSQRMGTDKLYLELEGMPVLARTLRVFDACDDAMHIAAIHKAAAPAIPVTDTIKETQQDVVVRTPDRANLVAVQTPQAFVPEILKAALTAAIRDGKEYTDDCAAVEALGVKVHLSKGSPENIKITRPLDLELAAGILRSRHE